ncbi:DUF2846 domain-containing protein [Variovorax sp. 160MFSha2.1]|uniref:DUF2846 domain-containing protein n=1 Tax=Variovorax sp. 160MFSha2.1 TaxID=3158367 RepID=UPI003AABF2C1
MIRTAGNFHTVRLPANNNVSTKKMKMGKMLKRPDLRTLLGRLAVIVALPPMLGACGAYGPAFTEPSAPNPNQGAIYVYRMTAFAAGASRQPVLVDGVQVAVLKNGGYFRRDLAPGNHTLEVKGYGPAAINFSVEPGKTLFYRYTIEHKSAEHIYGSLAFNHKFASSLDSIPPNIALIELKQTQGLD